MIRGGVPQSVAMTVTGHETDAMFRRYDITANEDKLEALRRRRAYVEQQDGGAGETGNRVRPLERLSRRGGG